MSHRCYGVRCSVRLIAGLCVVAGAFAGGRVLAAPEVVAWVEGEKPASANFEVNVEAPKTGLLSGGRWVSKGIGKGQIAGAIPSEGFLLTYELNIPRQGQYDLWARIGWESARAPFEWRIGDGDWQQVTPDRQTTSVMGLGLWMEVGWLKLAAVDLPAGPAVLRLRYREVGPGGRFLMGLDCVALIKGQWVPEGRLKPSDGYDSEDDRKAAAQVYRLPAPGAEGVRSEVKLIGLWQVARYDDPDMDVDTYEPVQELPSADEYPLHWTSISVPMSLWDKDETVFAHRVIYRTKVDVPAAHRGRGFCLHFSGTNWIASVFVNGKLAGTHQGVWIPWDLDITGFVEPGKVNDIDVAIKGPYYAIDDKNYRDRNNLDSYRNIPRGRQQGVAWLAPIYPSSKGDGQGTEYGLVNPVTLRSVGDAYTADVFIRPSVADRKLDVDVTVKNTGDRARTLTVACEAVYDRDDKVEKAIESFEMAVPAGGTATQTVAAAWADPKLWWPLPDPHLYRLRTTISEGGAPVDVHEELFGFREVTVKGTGIYINGVRRNFWNWVSVAGRPWDGDTWLGRFRGESNRFTRFSKNRKPSFFLPSREERLDFYDRNGIPGRLCSMIDGMFISFHLGDRITTNPGQWPPVVKFEPNKVLWENFRRHIDQLTRAYRNHPSVIMYQVENELVYINGMNRFSGEHLDLIEGLMAEVVETGRKNDPTRPYTVGGGGDLKDRIEINSPHYPVTSDDWYPENAYTLAHYSTKISRYPWGRKKPWIVGESAAGQWLRYAPWMIGDAAFRSAEHAGAGKAKYLRMLYGGYRWIGAAGFFPWDNLAEYEDARKTFSPLCVIPRKQTRRLYAGRRAELRFKVMNDTFSAEPVTFEWSYEVAGLKIAGETIRLDIEPGFGEERTLAITAPQADRRLNGTLTLKATQPGAADFVDVRNVPVLPVVERIDVAGPVTVLDPGGTVVAFLTGAGVQFKEIAALADAAGGKGLLIVGPDALTPAEAFGRDILAYAAAGNGIMVLEQEVPVAGGNLPTPLTTSKHFGGYAHPGALGTPLFRDLGKDDLTDWAGDHPTFKDAYRRPSQGARSLASCFYFFDGVEEFSTLVEVPCGTGVILLCQLRVGAKLDVEPAAGILLRNMIEAYAGYRPASGVAAVYAPGNRLLVDKLQATGRFIQTVADLGAALDPAKYAAVVVDATADNLAALKALQTRAEAFQEAGGWIMLCGLGPDGIDEFNDLLGTDHMIRPFRIERVTLERPDFPLAATLGCQDVALFSTKKMIHNRRWVSGNSYNCVVDGRDIAPFCLMPGGPDDPFVYKPTFNDRDPYNLVNGMFVSDDWRYYYSVWVDEGADSRSLTFRLRRPDTLAQINLWSNNVYWAIRDMDVIFDGDEAGKISVTLPVSSSVNEIKLPAPRRVQKTITFNVRSWREVNQARPDVRLLGIDYVQFLRPDPPEGAVFIDNVGGLVAYPHGKGGVFLNQVKFMADEAFKDNVPKKRALVGVILQNMGVGSQGRTVAVPGVNIRYEAVDITDYCTRHVTEIAGEPGWFGQAGMDLRNLKRGEQVLDHVMFHTVDYATAPVPDCIMLDAGNGALPGLPAHVTDIKVGRKADMVFFLHTANVRRAISDRARAQVGARKNPYTLPAAIRYVVHYADGGTVEVPVILDKHIDHWLKDKPVPLEKAGMAAAVDLAAGGGKKGVLYSMQWPNPRRDVEITSIDVILQKYKTGFYGNADYHSSAAVLAITLGTVLGEGPQ